MQNISKKLATAVITGALIVFQKDLGLDLSVEQILGLSITVVGYLFSQAGVDRKLIDKGLKGTKQSDTQG